MRLVSLIVLSFCSLYTFAGKGLYAVNTIPENLTKNANVVKRMEEVRFEVISLTETVLHKKYALTILNENGDDQAGFSESYDKLHQIRYLEGTLYDATGNVMKRTKSKDIQDISAVDGNNLMDDNRVKRHNFYCKAYPYTVEYEVEIKFNNTLFFPPWLPQEDENYSVEKSTYTIIAPANYTIRYKQFNYTGQPVSASEKSKQTLTWQVTNVAPIKSEYAAPAWHQLTTMVYFAPTDFEMEGYKGNMSNWQEFGKFVYSLKKDRDALPDNIKQKVQELIAGVPSDKEKVNILYQFMQQHTRYVNVSLGIGGWQPFDATYVAQKGYGDCKGLSNYMYSLLKEAGIKAYYTLVLAGGGRNIIDDFPAQQFNHVIVCAPLTNDTVWLECTNQTLPAGYVSYFTANRKALLIDEQGGRLVNTPVYDKKENIQIRTIKGSIKENGTLTSLIHTRYAAMQQDGLHEKLSYLSKDKVKESLQQELELATYEVNDFKYQEKKDRHPEIEEMLDISVANYATITGKRLFIAPNILNRSSRKLSTGEERVYDIQFGFGFTDVDSVELEVPAGYEVESLPKETALQTPFGTYSSSVKLIGNKIYYYRKREQFTGTFPAKEYKALADFYNNMYTADRSRIVLVKKG